MSLNVSTTLTPLSQSVVVLLRSSRSILRSRSSTEIESDQVRDLSYSIIADFPCVTATVISSTTRNARDVRRD